MQRAPIIDFFRDMELKVKTLYNISSTLSVLSSSMENIFGGEIKKIENDLAYLNSYIDNYSFLSRRRRFI
jgi:CII-binding regulator of phage lambda lysogenization HflD